MPLAFAICDDSPADRELLISLTRQWAAQTNTIVKLSEFTSAENYLFRAPEEGSPDVRHRRGGRYHHRFGGFPPCQKRTATL